MENLTNSASELNLSSTTVDNGDAKKVRRLSNRMFATVRSRMNGAKQRVASFTEQRDALKGIIRRRYLIINADDVEKSAIRRLSRAELTEYRARLADVKTLLERANADLRSAKKQYESEAVKRQEASTNGLLKQRNMIRATDKKDELRSNTVQKLKHAASNGGRQMVQDLQTKIASKEANAVKAELGAYMKANSPKLYEDVVASGVVYDRLMEKLLEDVAGIAMSSPADIDESTRTINSLETSR